MDAYDIAGACAEITAFIDALNNWYIRRSRERFWAQRATSTDKTDAYDTLYTVLVTLCRIAAPLLPMLTEEIHTGLCGGDSVHLCDWPDATQLPADPLLVESMDLVRSVCSAALGLREDHGLRTRLPLSRLTVAGSDADRLAGFVDLVADEVNVKTVELSDDATRFAEFVLRPNAKALGPKLGKAVQMVITAAKTGEWSDLGDGRVDVAGHTLGDGEFELVLQPVEGVAAASVGGSRSIVALDLTMTAELEAEGTTRDLIRVVQQARKERDLDVTARIALTVALPDDLASAVRAHEEQLRDAVLALSLEYTSAGELRGGRHAATLGTVPIEFAFDPL